MKKLLPLLSNKYIIILLLFTVWIGFFDRNNILRTLKTRNEIKRLSLDKEYYRKEIEKLKKNKEELKNNPKALEKIARENYHMKKDGEEIIFIETEKK